MQFAHFLGFALCVVVALMLATQDAVRAAPTEGCCGSAAEDAPSGSGLTAAENPSNPYAYRRGDTAIDVVSLVGGMVAGTAAYSGINSTRVYQKGLNKIGKKHPLTASLVSRLGRAS